MIKINDFVILNNTTDEVEQKSVGVIEEIVSENNYKVFFIGKRIELILTENDVSFLDIHQTGKPHKYKICNICHILKEDFVDFEINQTDAQGRKTTRPTCRNCRLEIDGVKLLESERKKMLQKKPKKFFVCPICQKGCVPGVTANLVIDHNHTNGIARE